MLKNNFKSSKEARTGEGETLKLDSFPDVTGRPTGQGFGAARTGPSVVTANAGGKVGMPARMRNR